LFLNAYSFVLLIQLGNFGENTYLQGQTRNYMSGEPTEGEIQDLKDRIVVYLTKQKRPLIIDSCLDIMLSQIKQNFNSELWTMFTDYFKRDEHDPFKGVPRELSLDQYFDDLCGTIFSEDSSENSKLNESTSSKNTEATTKTFDDFGCCLPCSCITLSGNRLIKHLQEPPPGSRIRNVELADAYYDYFIEKTDIDAITLKILNDLEFSGKFPILYYSPVGFISQVMINEINKGMSSRRKQRNSKSLKTIGMRLDSNYSGLKLSEIQIVPGMIIALQLITKFKEFYDFRKVVHTIEKIAGANQNLAASIASIVKSIDLLIRASEKFNYGTNAYNTVKSIAWKLGGFYLVIATSKQIGLSQERLDDIVDAARNMLLLNRTGTPAEKSKTRAYIDLALDFRDFILSIQAVEPDPFWKAEKNLLILLNINEATVERIIASFKETTGINLADKRWLQEDAVVSHDLPNKL
jgi:hypothetical protein